MLRLILRLPAPPLQDCSVAGERTYPRRRCGATVARSRWASIWRCV